MAQSLDCPPVLTSTGVTPLVDGGGTALPGVEASAGSTTSVRRPATTPTPTRPRGLRMRFIFAGSLLVFRGEGLAVTGPGHAVGAYNDFWCRNKHCRRPR